MPLITLTTDFGTRDSYVAQVKGELLRRGPAGLSLLDLSHALPPQDVRAAAFFLRYAVGRFPAGTVHLAVIDPGVGSARRAVALRAGEQLLVGPDNGIFAWLPAPPELAVELEPARLQLSRVTATFHGRDLFAPAAAALAGGRPLQELGPAVTLGGAPWPQPRSEPGRVHGEVVHVDHFGNLISNIPAAALAGLAAPRVLLAGHDLGPPARTYADVAQAAALALYGSEDLLEVAVRNGSAAERFGLGAGAPVVVEG